MKTMKLFFIFILLIAGFWIFSDIIIYLSINGTYKPVETKVYISSPEIAITESKATYINGYVKGAIKNNKEDTINNKYLKIDMYSARDNNLGTKYVKIDNLKQGEVQEFEMWYEFTDVDYVIITQTEHANNITDEELESTPWKFYMLFGKLMFVYFMI